MAALLFRGGRNGAVADPAPPVAFLDAHLISVFMRAFTHSTLNLGTRAQYLESANSIPILDQAGIRGGSEAFGQSAACVMSQVGLAGDPAYRRGRRRSRFPAARRWQHGPALPGSTVPLLRVAGPVSRSGPSWARRLGWR